jgi:NADH dehydrogenase FAD-containing subunit
LAAGAAFALSDMDSTSRLIRQILVSRAKCGRLVVNESLELKHWPGVWALGGLRSHSGGYYPPTAQHALREGGVVGRNIVALLHGGKKKTFSFSTIGQLAVIGRRTRGWPIFSA